jgi:hypothetical protein
MLRELLALIDSGRFLTREGMARALGVGLPEVDDMFDRLASLGYVEEIEGCGAEQGGSCPEGTSSCSGCAGCCLGSTLLFADSRARVWRLSDKGRKALG